MQHFTTCVSTSFNMFLSSKDKENSHKTVVFIKGVSTFSKQIQCVPQKGVGESGSAVVVRGIDR